MRGQGQHKRGVCAAVAGTRDNGISWVPISPRRRATSSGRLSKSKEGSAYHVGLAHLAPASLDADGRPRGECGRGGGEGTGGGMGISGGQAVRGVRPGQFFYPMPITAGLWEAGRSRGRPTLWGDKVVVAAMAAGGGLQRLVQRQVAAVGDRKCEGSCFAWGRRTVQ
jgi:hypothetical protein